MSQIIADSKVTRSVAGLREFKLAPARSEHYAPPIQIDASYAYDGSNTGFERTLRPGTIMARITATKLWVPCKRTQTNAGATSAAVTVDNAAFFKAGDKISVGADTNLTISSVDYETNTITLSSSITYADNEAVIGSETVLAGSEIARGILDEEIDLYDPATRDYVDKATGRLLVEGQVIKSQLLGDYDAITASGVTHYLGELKTDVQLGAD